MHQKPTERNPNPIMKTVAGWLNLDLRRPIMFLRSVWYLALIVGAIIAVIGLVLEFAKLAMVML